MRHRELMRSGVAVAAGASNRLNAAVALKLASKKVAQNGRGMECATQRTGEFLPEMVARSRALSASLVASPPVPISRPPRPVSPEAVRSQLARILRSEGFFHATRMRRFLEYVVEETLAGRANQLCEYAIGVSVFGRGESFEPGLDPIVRNDARRLRQKLLEYYHRPQSADPDPLTIEVPKGGYVPVFRRAAVLIGPQPDEKYRLVIKLIRSTDGAEVWGTENEFTL